MRDQPGPIRSASGAAMVEAVVALPIVLALLFAGFLFGYYLYVKLVLSWHMMEESEQFALSPPLVAAYQDLRQIKSRDSPPTLRPDRYKGVHFAVPLGGNSFAVAVGCYPMPIRLPRLLGDTNRSRPALAAQSEFSRLLLQLQQSTSDLESLAEQAEDLLDDAHFAQEMISALAARDRPDRQRQALRMFVGSIVETAVRRECAPHGEWVVSSRAVIWSEKTRILY